MMLLNNVKSAFGEKRQASAKKTQDSNIIERIKESTLNHILSNMNGTQIGPPAVDFSFSESNVGFSQIFKFLFYFFRKAANEKKLRKRHIQVRRKGLNSITMK